MFCILSIDNSEPDGWIIAKTQEAAAAAAEAAGLPDLAAEIRKVTVSRSGKIPLTGNRWMLVSLPLAPESTINSWAPDDDADRPFPVLLLDGPRDLAGETATCKGAPYVGQVVDVSRWFQEETRIR